MDYAFPTAGEMAWSDAQKAIDDTAKLQARIDMLEAMFKEIMPLFFDTRSQMADVRRYLVLTNDRIAELKVSIDALQRPQG